MIRKKPTISQFRRALGTRIRAARHAAHMTQIELGEQLGVSFQQIQNYETGKSKLHAEGLSTLCKALRITPHKLLGWHEFVEEVRFAHESVFVMNYDKFVEHHFNSAH